MGCSVFANNSNKVSDLKHWVMRIEATGNTELVLWDSREFDHLRIS